MWRIVQLEEPQDLVIATGSAYSLRDFLQAAFETVDLDWRSYVRGEPGLFRPSDPKVIVGDPTAAFKVLGWKAVKHAPEIARDLVQSVKERR
jgi:GDPmannose 4,6-dehydratase